MPETARTDDVEKLLSEQKAIEERKQHLIDDLLRQREAANKDFDEKLAKLGYMTRTKSGKMKRSHHKAATSPAADAPVKPKVKADKA